MCAHAELKPLNLCFLCSRARWDWPQRPKFQNWDLHTWISIGNWILNLICFLQFFDLSTPSAAKMRFYFLPFTWSKNRHFCQKCPSLRPKKWHFWWQNQNSKTTFIVQTFPKYCRNGFYFMKLSLLSPILAKFQFCWFLDLFWAFFPCKKYKKWNRRRTAEGVLK